MAGEKKKIGPAAMRAWVEKGRPDPDAIPVPATMPPALPPARRFSDVVIAGAVLGVQIFWAGRTLTKFIRKRV